MFAGGNIAAYRHILPRAPGFLSKDGANDTNNLGVSGEI